MIRIGINPNLVDTPLLISWHGFLTFVSVAVAVTLIVRWARREEIDSDTIYAVAVWAVIGGIIGARLVHVIDRWDYYGQNPGQILAVWRGGIGLWGAILFGFAGGAAYVWGRQLLGRIYAGQTMQWFKRLAPDRIGEGYLKGHMYAKFKDVSVGRLADLTAPALLITQSIGRIGDIINGEHFAERTSLPWGFIYNHPTTIRLYDFQGMSSFLPTHPVAVYEIIWNMLVLGFIWTLRGRLAPPGMLFAVYLLLYALGRFFIQFLRLDRVWFGGLQEAHIIALIVLAITVIVLASKARWIKKVPASTARRGRQARARR